MIAEKKLVYNKETGMYQKVTGVKYQYPPRPKNPLVYDKETGVYQKEERQAKRAKVEKHSGEDVSEVYVPMERTYATSIVNVPQRSFESDYLKNFKPSSKVRYIGGCQSDYIKNFKIPN